ncbi:DinB family protein [Labrys neptuniae]
MGSQTLLMSLYRYKSWADDLMLDAMIEVERAGPLPGFGAALRILNHAHIVDRIFMAHLEGRSHGYDDNEPDDLPALKDLFADIRQTDSAYVDYIAGLPAEELRETVRFRFTDGQPGRMSREEMLAHVVTHAGYHRGEIGRLLPQIAEAASVDVFAGYLHRSDPDRRI